MATIRPATSSWSMASITTTLDRTARSLFTPRSMPSRNSRFFITVAKNLEFLDGIDRGVNKDRAVRSNVVVIDAIDHEDVAGRIVAIHREVDACEQTLVLAVKVRLR